MLIICAKISLAWKFLIATALLNGDFQASMFSDTLLFYMMYELFVERMLPTMGLFSFVKEKLQKVYSNVTSKITSLFSRSRPDKAFLDELGALLLAADTGVKATNSIIEKLDERIKKLHLEDMNLVKEHLENLLVEMLSLPENNKNENPDVVMMVGVNGSGKTTFISKYAQKLKNNGKKILIVAGDTFRAAACQQLAEWGKRVGVEVFVGKDGQDPAAVIFDACTAFKNGGFDSLIIDTAGRLQTKVNLMKELEKISKVVKRQLPERSIVTWLTVDAMLGQNSLRQAELFHEATNLDGVVLTKFDGTGKGGTVFSIASTYSLPIVYMTFGEQPDDLKQFSSQEYVYQLLND